MRTTISLDGLDCASTVIQINERGGMHATVGEIRGVNNSPIVVFDEVIGPRIVRICVRMSPSVNAVANVTLDQGALRILDAVQVEADTEFVFSVA
jgi:hypothetical protein